MSIEAVLQQALNHHSDARFAEAEQLYRAILLAEPAHPDANHNLGVLSVQINRTAQGLPFFKAAVAASPERSDFWSAYIEALTLCGQANEAHAVQKQAQARGLRIGTLPTENPQHENSGAGAIMAGQSELLALTRALDTEIASRKAEVAALKQTIAAFEYQHARDAELLEALLPDTLQALLERKPSVGPSPDTIPRVSIIMPVRDRAGQVQVALASLQAQTMPAWEVIVVSDGSTDRTAEVVESIAASDPRVRLLLLPPSGVSAARNHGLKHARSEIIAYLDSDNRAFPDYLSQLVAALDAAPEAQSAYVALVSDGAHARGRRVLWQPWDRAAMLYNNFIDLNVFAHRRALYERLGGFDQQLTRLVDWDLILRYTEKQAPMRLPVVGTSYSTGGADRISCRADFGHNRFLIRRKWQPKAALRPRVLYAFAQRAHASETSVATEIEALRRIGAEIEIWSYDGDAAPGNGVAARHGHDALAAVIDSLRPHVVHVSEPGLLPVVAAAAQPRNIGVTLRPHHAGNVHDAFAACDAQGGGVYADLFPPQAAMMPARPGLRTTPAVFDTNLFTPPTDAKDARLVLHAARLSGQPPAQQFALVLEAARRLPGHRFALVLTIDHGRTQLDALRAVIVRLGVRIEIHVNPSRAEFAALMARSSLYLYSVAADDDLSVALGSMAAPIAEAMACGTLPLVPDIAALNDYAGPASLSYATFDELVSRIAQTATWSEDVWQQYRAAVSDRAFERNADEFALRPLFDAWCGFASGAAGFVRA